MGVTSAFGLWGSKILGVLGVDVSHWAFWQVSANATYFSGIASFSLHGWVWAVMAMVGTFVGLRLRPLFGLTNPKPVDSIC